MFTNEMAFTKENIREYRIAFWKKRKGAKIYVGLLLLLFLSGLFNCIYGAATGDMAFSSVLFVAAPLICAAAIGFQIKNGIQMEYKRYLELNDGKEQICSCKIGDSIVIHNQGNDKVRNISYEEIAEVIETQNLIVLILRTNSIIPLDKDRIKGGTAEELADYINEARKN